MNIEYSCTSQETDKILILFLYELLQRCPADVEDALHVAIIQIERMNNHKIFLNNGWIAGMACDISRILTGDNTVHG